MTTGITEQTCIRWLIRRDMDDVLSIENRCFQYPWTESEFIVALRQRSCIGVVCETGWHVHGFMLYELHKRELKLLNIAVDPDDHRCGFGRMMIQRLIDKLKQQRRDTITAEVRETNTAAQLVLQACGFQAVSVLRGHYDETPEDAYLFRYQLEFSEEIR